jgi:hypothetical protein
LVPTAPDGETFIAPAHNREDTIADYTNGSVFFDKQENK